MAATTSDIEYSPGPGPGRAAAAPPPVSLLARMVAGEQHAVVSFAGQGTDALTELATLVAQRPALREELALATAVLAEAAGSPAGQSGGGPRHGIDLAAWADDPAGAPPREYLRSAAVSSR